MNHSSLYTSNGNFADEFLVNLVKTINWTEKIIAGIQDKSGIDYARVLRTINPVYNGQPFYFYGDGFASTIDIPFSYRAILEEVLKLRTDSLLPADDLNKLGKLLQFEIDVTTHDGAPTAETDGFIDESDIPPIDTWVFVTRKHLYCWIPVMFVDKMQDAIDVEILGSYCWIDISHILIK